MKRAFSKLDKNSTGTLNQQQFYRLIQALTKDNPTSKKVTEGAWNAVHTMDDRNTNAITFTDFQTWCFRSLDKKDAKKQWHKSIERFKQKAKTSHESQRIQQEGEISSIRLHNKMLQRQHAANRRLQKRLSFRSGTTVVPVQQPQYRPVPTYTTKQVTNKFTSTHVLEAAKEHCNTEEAKAIQAKSQKSRSKNIQKNKLKKTNAEAHLQKRLALRHRAKQERALKTCKPFQTLSDTAQDQIVDAMVFEKIRDGAVLCKQGSNADKMYLLMSGHCTVHIDELHVANLYQRDIFGETALFNTGTSQMLRSATVVASDEVEVLVLSCEAMTVLVDSNVLGEETLAALEAVRLQRTVENEKLIQENEEGDGEIVIVEHDE